MGNDCASQIFTGLGIRRLLDLSGEIEIIPADDGVPDQPVAGFCDLLLFLFGLGVFARVSYGHGAGEAVGEFDLVELFLDGLPEREVIDIAQDKEGFDDLSEGFEGLIQSMLARVGVQSSEDVGRGVFLELDSGHEAAAR